MSTANAAPAQAPAGRYVARPGQVGYGVSIGILCLEANVPFVPGDVGNASSYDFPVAYQLVPGATGQAVIVDKDEALIPRFVEAAQTMVGQGVRAITGDCGYMATYQAAVAAAVDVPVFLSSMLQIPLLLRMLAPQRKLGVVVANEGSFDDRLLDAVGVAPADRERLLIRGVQDKPHWREVILEEIGHLDVERIRGEVVETAAAMLDEEPNLAGYLLECSDLPPYSADVHRATGLPVFDWIGFVNYVHHAVVRTTPYRGFV